VAQGFLKFIRSDYVAEFVANALRDWFAGLGVKSLVITSASPLEIGYCERLHGRLRNEPSNDELFYSLSEWRLVTHTPSRRSWLRVGRNPCNRRSLQRPAAAERHSVLSRGDVFFQLPPALVQAARPDNAMLTLLIVSQGHVWGGQQHWRRRPQPHDSPSRRLMS
jgi:transposase InsO family protein